MPLLQKMISIISLTACVCVLLLSLALLSILQNDLFYWKDDDDGCLVCVRQSLETQMATFSYFFLTLCYDAEMSPSKITPSIHPFLPLCPSFPVSILYVAISERLLLLLMGDVNHRCANNMKKHVHSTANERGRTR
jgi:hypothetical protein